jgi:hypothetical protein
VGVFRLLATVRNGFLVVPRCDGALMIQSVRSSSVLGGVVLTAWTTEFQLGIWIFLKVDASRSVFGHQNVWVGCTLTAFKRRPVCKRHFGFLPLHTAPMMSPTAAATNLCNISTQLHHLSRCKAFVFIVPRSVSWKGTEAAIWYTRETWLVIRSPRC